MDHSQAPDGVAYVAAKSYYFGVGGSTRGFEESVARLTPHRSVTRATLIQVSPSHRLSDSGSNRYSNQGQGLGIIPVNPWKIGIGGC